jgi:hypothetical protein
VREQAQAEAAQINAKAKRLAQERVAAAQDAADEALAEARTVAAALRQLSQAIDSQAERVLSDVQAGHRRIQAELRAVAGIPERDTRLEPPEFMAPGRRRASRP